MRKGKVKIMPLFIKEGLNFPYDWEIEDMVFHKDKDYIEAIISGSDFPEEIDGKIKECRINIHTGYMRFEVEEVK